MTEPEAWPWAVVKEVIVRVEGDRPRVVARTRELPARIDEVAKQLSAKFGDRPRGVRCPAAVFAVVVDEYFVWVGQAADLPPTALGFRFLIFHRRTYPGDPFVVADRFPPNWNAAGDLDPLDWPAEPLPRRTADDLQRLLKAGDSSLLLGGCRRCSTAAS